MLYAGAQKNIGPAGVTLVIARRDLVERAGARAARPCCATRRTPKESSLYNTPPTFGIYLMGRVFQWIQRQGGLAGMEQQNREKAQLLYDALAATRLLRARTPARAAAR